MPTASWSKGFHSTLSGKCARTFDLKVLRRGLCSKFSPKTEGKKADTHKKKEKKEEKLKTVHTPMSRQKEQKNSMRITSRFKMQP